MKNRNKKNKYIDGETVISISLLLIIIGLLIITIIFDNSNIITNNEPVHKCTMFVKYDKQYMITPLTWGYRESFKCIECNKDYKD